jgi:hypothetical protein
MNTKNYSNVKSTQEFDQKLLKFFIGTKNKLQDIYMDQKLI